MSGAEPADRGALRRAVALGLAMAALPALYTAITAGLSDDALLRTWLAGGLVPGRMAAEPWRIVTAPLLHLDGAHLAVNGALLVILGAAVTVRAGALQAALTAIVAAAMGCTASVLEARGWAAGASGAVFGLLGAITVHVGRRDRRGALWLGLLAGSLWWAVPADKAAHLGGLVGGAGFAMLPLPPRVGRAAALAAAGLALVGLSFAAHHVATADALPDGWQERGGIAVPAGWSPGVPIPPCTVAWTDGLATLCPAEAPPADLPGVEAHPLPEKRFLLTHAVSPAARALRAPLFEAAVTRSMNTAGGPPSGAPRR